MFSVECHIAGLIRCSNKQWSWFSWSSPNLDSENFQSPRCMVGICNTKMGSQRLSFRQVSVEKYNRRHSPERTFAVSVNLEGRPFSSSPEFNGDDVSLEGLSDMATPGKLGISELKSLLADSQRSKLVNKLSEANQHNRFLKRQLQLKEDELVNFKQELAVMELEMQALASLAGEVAKSGIPAGSRKINGKYIQSVLLTRLRAVHAKLKEQVKDVDVIQSKEVSLSWAGMAENVQVMGSFDGWSQGEHLSPEYTGSLMNFSTVLMLRPGRYEIKFLVDGDWKLSSELPTTGEGMMENNLLIVE
ncbi:hypothetical protein ACHQM5_030798 [Ranunculus cassubicifolius]